jgi:hypothetical protein
MADLIRLHKSRNGTRGHFFTKIELGQLLSLYSSRVIAGEWRDYAIDHRDDAAIFSIFRHTHEHPLFAVAKITRRGQQAPLWVLFHGQRKIAQSASLSEIIARFDKLPRLVTS